MIGRWAAIIVMAFVVSAICASVVAQTQSKGTPDTEKVFDRLPGLDKQLIDASADPCVDFSGYACGNFSKLYPIPSDRSGFGPGAMVAEYNQTVLHTMLEKAAAGGAERSANEQKIGDYYASCMDQDVIDRKGLAPLQGELDRIAALQSKDELTPLLAHYQLIGVNAFLNFGEQQDLKDARKQIAAVDQGGLGLPERDYYFRSGDAAEKTRNEYVQHIANVLKLMGEPLRATPRQLCSLRPR
jgi:putative endopeptidase